MPDIPTALVTGGAGFIGANVGLREVSRGTTVVNFDKFTYVDRLKSLGLNPLPNEPKASQQVWRH